MREGRRNKRRVRGWIKKEREKEQLKENWRGGTEEKARGEKDRRRREKVNALKETGADN